MRFVDVFDLPEERPKRIVIASGYFNPLHVGHVEYLHLAKSCGDELCVIVNNDVQRALKGSSYFMNEQERLLIIKSLRDVDHVILSIDDDRTVCNTLREISKVHAPKWHNNCNLYFANGGDQKNDSIPERAVCEELGIALIDRLGEKIQSSSWLIDGGRNEPY